MNFFKDIKSLADYIDYDGDEIVIGEQPEPLYITKGNVIYVDFRRTNDQV